MCRKLGVSEQAFYRWRSEYGGLKLDQARRLRERGRENARLDGAAHPRLLRYSRRRRARRSRPPDTPPGVTNGQN